MCIDYSDEHLTFGFERWMNVNSILIGLQFPVPFEIQCIAIYNPLPCFSAFPIAKDVWVLWRYGEAQPIESSDD